jgi:FAD/FMN-containing dehydrogenase
MSYGDAAQNAEAAVVDVSGINRIIEVDSDTGIVTAEPGVTIEDLWQRCLPLGWWPPVVPGTMHVTVGGALAMNIHGKNNCRVGTIGEHVESLAMLDARGERHTCSRDSNPDLFYAVIGGAGLLGPIVRASLRMKRVTTGLLDVEGIAAESLKRMLEVFEEHALSSDYIVGWIDALAGGEQLGRGVVHRADYVASEELSASESPALTPDEQHLPTSILGVVPKSMAWRFLRFFVNNAGMRIINAAKYRSAAIRSPHAFRQGLVPFSFLLDYVPNWKRAYGSGGLVQYQCFVPASNAAAVFESLLQIGQANRLPSYLAVLKRHRKDAFLFSHGVDGYSLALDYKITDRNRAAFVAMGEEMNRVVLKNGGRFYFAKDSLLTERETRSYLGDDAIKKMSALKAEYDPDAIFQSNLTRRVLGDSLGLKRPLSPKT